MNQNYRKYTAEDFKVWETLFERQMEILPELASQSYLEAVDVVKFKSDKIPDFQEVNAILKEESGWQLKVVPNIIPNEEFFPLLSNQTFSATTWLRKMSQLDYLDEPDMFHDVFGHVPLLSNPTFCAFFKGLAEIAMKYIDDSKAIEMLGRMYWFTIEFGLIRENGSLKIYGAGILSSHGETKFSLSDEPEHLEFDVAAVLEQDYDNMKIQDKYFVIESFDQLFQSLDKIEEYVQSKVETPIQNPVA
ncbi:phenylalanine 4-monooxygenase [Cryomorphaceae bacterium 1068]|nr:phenylalanine 4-monooxygenase [Cryomorphaceae bacterium 1068]